MKLVKVAIECEQAFTSKEGKQMYAIKVAGNRGRDRDGNYLKDITWFCDEDTYQRIASNTDDEGNVKGVILKFVGPSSVRG